MEVKLATKFMQTSSELTKDHDHGANLTKEKTNGLSGCSCVATVLIQQSFPAVKISVHSSNNNEKFLAAISNCGQVVLVLQTDWPAVPQSSHRLVRKIDQYQSQ